ncbi:cupin domain-containing protein [Kitasatospora sp. SUK 42]|uniref:cupin domain-containing protein n=1 Tax=Kitasatospora sp. SUK 42 TaxID=1588882 RepID=UPI0018C93915|nr:cupin domain-containing protein [Kitasatospora sp. SUK 42]MBV2153291.1 cupin domain-containing protein [Kitasatospora sp. SUK 42]
MTTTPAPVILSFLPGEHSPSGMVVHEVTERPDLAQRPFSASRFTVPPGATSELDQHEVAELWMVAAGCGTVHSEERRLDIGAGDVVLLPSRAPHRLENTGSQPVEVFSVWWQENRS